MRCAPTASGSRASRRACCRWPNGISCSSRGRRGGAGRPRPPGRGPAPGGGRGPLSAPAGASWSLGARGSAIPPPPPFLVLLQFADGLFPAGGFAHSFGLETYAQEGRVRERAGLEAFVTAHLEGAAGPGDAVAPAVATRLAAAPDPSAWRALDARLAPLNTA